MKNTNSRFSENFLAKFSKCFLFAAAIGAMAGTAEAVTATDVYKDPLVSTQWQWDPSRGGINIADAWDAGITGEGIVIGIIDQWVEPFHEDLNVSKYNTATSWQDADLSKGLSYDFKNPGFSPSKSAEQVYQERKHGTACAGMAAAVGGNGIGLVGAAPSAIIAGLNASTDDSEGIGVTSAHYYWASGVTSSNSYSGEALIDVKSNSYTSAYGKSSGIINGVYQTSKNNVIYCFGAANSRSASNHQYDLPTNTGWQTYGNDRSVIVVAATTSSGQYATFSNYGANIFIAAPGVSVPSTDRTGDIGYDEGEYTNFAGTSAATPLVAGVMALGKQVFKEMDYRWAKYALAWSSGHNATPNIDSAGTFHYSWEESTGFWQRNNGGFWFNNNYGFGLIDAVGFVDTTRDILYTTIESDFIVNNISGGNVVTNDSSRSSTFSFTPTTLSSTENIETVSVRVNFSSDAQTNLNLSTLKVTLIAPDGDSSIIVQPSVGDPEKIGGLSYYTFLTNAFWGASYDNISEWTIQVEYDVDYALLDTTDWVTVSQVEFTTGAAIFESDDASVAAGTTVDAHAIAIDSGNFEVAGTMRLEDSVAVNAGTLTLAATGTLEAYTDGFFGDQKGIKYYQTGGTANFAGTAYFERGFKQSGGTFNLTGTLGTRDGIAISNDATFRLENGANLSSNIDISGENASLAISVGGNINYSSGTMDIFDAATIIFESAFTTTPTDSALTINSSASIIVDPSVKVLVILDENVADFSDYEFVAISAASLAAVQLTEANLLIQGNDGDYLGNYELIKNQNTLTISVFADSDLISEIDEIKEISDDRPA